MDHGQLVTQSTLADLTADSHHVIRVRTPRAEDLGAALSAQGATAQLVAGDQLAITGATGEQIGILAAERAIPIFETTTEETDLEDIFLRLTTDATRIEVSR
jgi:ABC-2 type transport system ATP-binding protein